MNDGETAAILLDNSAPPQPDDFEQGFSIEHILLSVTVVHTSRLMQYDDSCAHMIEKHLSEYNGVKRVKVDVQYHHGKTERHANQCTCHNCQPAPI